VDGGIGILARRAGPAGRPKLAVGWRLVELGAEVNAGSSRHWCRTPLAWATDARVVIVTTRRGIKNLFLLVSLPVGEGSTPQSGPPAAWDMPEPSHRWDAVLRRRTRSAFLTGATFPEIVGYIIGFLLFSGIPILVAELTKRKDGKDK
jgi:hypothetical protein